MSTAILPAYDLPPQYTSSPQPDETTVAHNRRQGIRNTDGRFIRHWGDITLVLKEQDSDTRYPVYSRGGNVDGEIGFNGQIGLVEVFVKVCEVRMESFHTIHLLSTALRSNEFDGYRVWVDYNSAGVRLPHPMDARREHQMPFHFALQHTLPTNVQG